MERYNLEMELELMDEVEASAYWYPEAPEEPIRVVVDVLAPRSNTSYLKIAKYMSHLYLRELICKLHAQECGFSWDNCKVSWCPMKEMAKRME